MNESKRNLSFNFTTGNVGFDIKVDPLKLVGLFLLGKGVLVVTDKIKALNLKK